jgi:putative ATP-dependent endonuclease of OLD family
VWRIVERNAWQKIVTTHSEAILLNAPLTSLRRLTRSRGVVREWAVDPSALSGDALRKVSYHLRSRRASAMFARCWILVEGETEYWIVPELARILGYDLAAEGVACVEFAQCGVAPLLTLADQLGIDCHVLVDGDEAGRHYQEAARAVHATGVRREHPVTMLAEPDIEHCFWRHGFADVIRGVARMPETGGRTRATPAIRRAIERTSKPFLALTLIDAAAGRGPDAVPRVFREAIESAVRMARA